MYWCDFQVLKDRTNYLIIVLCEDVSTEDLDEDMHLYLKTNTYLSRDCHWFWKKLRYALPHRPLTELLKDKESRWKDGWSGLEALAYAQDETHKKAMIKCQHQNGEKKHCCQYIRPKNRYLDRDENHDNNAYRIQDEIRDEQNDGKDHQFTNMKTNQVGDRRPHEDHFRGRTNDEQPRANNKNKGNIVLNIEFRECEKRVNYAAVDEVTKL